MRTYLHPGGLTALYNRNSFASMNPVRADGVTVQVAHWLNYENKNCKRLHLCNTQKCRSVTNAVLSYLGMFCHPTPLHMTPSLPVWTLQHHRDARQCLQTERTHNSGFHQLFSYFILFLMLYSVQQGYKTLKSCKISWLTRITVVNNVVFRTTKWTLKHGAS